MLTRFETDALIRLEQKRTLTRAQDELNWRYYHARQRIKHLGMALPGSLQHRMNVISNWPRVMVDGIVSRQQVASVRRIDQATEDEDIRLIMDASNYDWQLSMFNRDRCIYGRAIMSVFPDASGMPRLRCESPREMVVEISEYDEAITAAARFYGDDLTLATLYLLGDENEPSRTVHVERDRYGHHWRELKRDEYDGPLSLFLHINRRESGSWVGESQMADLLPLADAAARALTLLGFSQDAHGFPKVVMAGVQAGDFTDGDGNLIPRIEAYFNTLTLLKDKDAKPYQLTPADLKNFDTSLQMYGYQASAVTSMPPDYFGIEPKNNPSSEGALNFAEARFVRSIEQQNAEVQVTQEWALAYALGMKQDRPIEGNQVKLYWHDPSTPTMAQRFDALVKAKQVGALSMQGMWDELGWSKARKERELEYLAQEADDPLLARFDALMGNDPGSNV